MLAQQTAQLPVNANESGPDAKAAQSQIDGMMDNLTDMQKYEILVFAMEKNNVKADRKIKRLLKKMSPKDRKSLLTYAETKSNVTKTGKMANYRQKVPKTTATPNRPKTRAPKTITPVQKGTQNNRKVDTSAKPSRKILDTDPTKVNDTALPVVTTSVEFDDSEFNFGNIDQGDKVTHIFTFKNTGTNPLVISNAKGSCGCTVPKWPKEAIAPGETGVVEVTFNSRGKKGKQAKRVTITANTDPAQTILMVKGEVDLPEGTTN